MNKRIQNNQEMAQFIRNLISRRNCPVDSVEKNVSNSVPLSTLYSISLEKKGKFKLDLGVLVFLSNYELPFKNSYKPWYRKNEPKLLQLLPDNRKREK